MKKITLFLILLPFFAFSQNIVYNFNTTGDVEGFTQGGIGSFDVPAPGGSLECSGWTGGFQQVRSPEGLNLVEADYAILRIVVENATNNDIWQVINYDTADQNAGQGEKLDFTMPIVTAGSGFTTFDLAIPVNPDNGGTLDRVGIRAKQGNTFGLTGTLKIDQFMIVNTIVEDMWVANPNFETSSDWSASGGETTASFSTMSPQEGSQSGVLTFTADQTSNQFLENTIYDFGMEVNPEEINSTFWVRSSRAGIQVQITYDIFDAAGTKITGNNTGAYTITAADTWEEVTTNKVINDPFHQIQYRLKVRSQSNALTGDVVMFDNVTASFTYATLSNESFETTPNFTMYPNPVKNELFINSENDIQKVEIFNITGQRILEANNSKRINTSSLRNGIYMVKLTSENGGVSVKKLIKN
ncbi:putative secreted protein (Por secretion system target) [Kordia periserrulae]|uniref:Putative secreted protein (Por secretion system target) n=1 Tax=Kordia periserrulae TaxID=701523 RepID=A0A2T6C1Z2_9FLAO|nr:T9SS type A sorting domain-containing protein [Kordia periserrulae]PTX62342.1 putative secreted protein (Por secretion system target) [Kordia periserrulae]